MRYIKTFEDIENKPRIGDYVLMRSEAGYPDVEKFVNNTIGQIYNFEMGGGVIIKYENPPNNYGKERMFHRSQIVAFASTIEELKLKIRTIKYNL
jgi:hypothetical protein